MTLHFVWGQLLTKQTVTVVLKLLSFKAAYLLHTTEYQFSKNSWPRTLHQKCVFSLSFDHFYRFDTPFCILGLSIFCLFFAGLFGILQVPQTCHLEAPWERKEAILAGHYTHI